jgi:hypothetical protein
MVMTLIAFATIATAAHAQVEVLDENGNAHCPAVELTGHTITGGCHVEYQSTDHIRHVGYLFAPVIVSICDIHFDARIGEDGFGYVTSATFSAEPEGTSPSCTREPCRETTGEFIPWSLGIEEAAGSERMELGFCVQVIGNPAASAWCLTHLPVVFNFNHDHFIGEQGEYFCEGTQFPVSMQGVRFLDEDPFAGENIEVVH